MIQTRTVLKFFAVITTLLPFNIMLPSNQHDAASLNISATVHASGPLTVARSLYEYVLKPAGKGVLGALSVAAASRLFSQVSGVNRVVGTTGSLACFIATLPLDIEKIKKSPLSYVGDFGLWCVGFAVTNALLMKS